MTFEQWLAANGYDAETLSKPENAKQLAHLRLAWKAETEPEPRRDPAASFQEQLRAAEQENERITYIREATVAAVQRNIGDPNKCQQIQQLGTAAAARDSKVSPRDFDLSLLRLERSIGAMVLQPATGVQLNEQLLEAAVCMTHKLPGHEKMFSDQVLQAAHSRFRRGIGLKELLLIAAERNSGYRGSTSDEAALCRAAFAPQMPHGMASYYGFGASDASPSTLSVSGILSNVANKFLAGGFLNTEQSYRDVAEVRPARDFKQMSIYRLTGANKFKKVPPGGQLKHGTLSDLTYHLQVDEYGIVLGIDRRDIINDDLGAFTSATKEVGRGAGDALNEVFWTDTWLVDSAFFPTDKSLNNYDDGATDSVLTLAGLDNADTIFRRQTKPDGTPLGAIPKILLVPASLYNTALTLMGAQGLVVGTTPATGANNNVFFGRYRTVTSAYLDAASTTAWYLLADPNNIACIAIGYLNGAEAPTVEMGAFEFDRLGLGMRAYFDFGVSLQEYRGGVKMKGAA